jgi:hypothetical protein
MNHNINWVLLLEYQLNIVVRSHSKIIIDVIVYHRYIYLNSGLINWPVYKEIAEIKVSKLDFLNLKIQWSK